MSKIVTLKNSFRVDCKLLSERRIGDNDIKGIFGDVIARLAAPFG